MSEKSSTAQVTWQRQSYSFNANLQGVSIANLSAPASTVVVYEGRGQRGLPA